MKTINKKILSFVLALVMALGVAGFAFAADGGVGYTPDPINDNLWSADYASYVPFTQVLSIDNAPISFPLGINTIEILEHKGTNYTLVLHPQYFPDSDNQYNAQYAMEMNRISVLDPVSGDYVECQDGGFATIPDSYACNESYFVCRVFSSILDINTGLYIDASWNTVPPVYQTVYLRIPPGI
jgi:hypothetical protein